MTTLDPNDARPSYRQVADRLRGAIEGEKLAPGDQLPTHKALADEYGVAVETVKRALELLRTDGLIVSRQGKGSYVRAGTRGSQEGQAAGPDVAARLEELTLEMERIKARLSALEGESAT
jgi:DNA-binding GntR family transcriptional regulator